MVPTLHWHHSVSMELQVDQTPAPPLLNVPHPWEQDNEGRKVIMPATCEALLLSFQFILTANADDDEPGCKSSPLLTTVRPHASTFRFTSTLRFPVRLPPSQRRGCATSPRS
ncbi:unnamed protein product [Hydatigera taeniaeformis]|uniref:Uncharacterized protein n=1 Tax=Hydatigena taeniaeformis TaxID=6205 RepID=A0A0R3X7P9_HYDTA|nr:unnamed protein product [Hydatigera taeniaeformis]